MELLVTTDSQLLYLGLLLLQLGQHGCLELLLVYAPVYLHCQLGHLNSYIVLYLFPGGPDLAVEEGN